MGSGVQAPVTAPHWPSLPQVVVAEPVKPGEQVAMHVAGVASPLQLAGQGWAFDGGDGNSPLQTAVSKAASKATHAVL